MAFKSLGSAAHVERYRSPSGNPDHDYWLPRCPKCPWTGAYYSNRTIEGRSLAQRDAEDHYRARHTD